MSTQLLIYKTAVPVSRTRHGNTFVEVDGHYAFSGEVNSVPLMAAEFPRAANEYVIVFGGSGTEIMPAVILGLRGNENLFLSSDSSWKGRYVPAFLRRYPFAFSPLGDRLVLCVDEGYPGVNKDKKGQPLFTDEGESSPYVGNVLRFLRAYQAQFQRTKRFCARLVELDLLEPRQAQVTPRAGRNVSLGGFMTVSRDKLKALPAEIKDELAKSDELELMYLHLHSMRNLDGLRELLESRRVSSINETIISTAVH